MKTKKATIEDRKSENPERPLPDASGPLTLAARLQITVVPITDLSAHPDNPRTINLTSPKFLELVDSIRANGILEALTVRALPQTGFLQILSGHRRFAAARAADLTSVPVRNLGQIGDELAYDIVAMANLHEDLTPLEEGKRAAVWLDKYKQDASAVASKLGKSEHWVLTHAMIDRNLIPAWKEEAVYVQKTDWHGYEVQGPRDYSHWTAAHWVQIARLPAAIQEHWLGKIQKCYPFDPHDASAEKVGEWLETEKLFLDKAPFPALRDAGQPGWCHNCPKRTDAINQLLWQDPDVKGDTAAVRCLDPKCWDRKVDKHERDKYRVMLEAAVAKSEIRDSKSEITKPVPISLVVPSGFDYSKRKQYDRKMSRLRKVVGRDLVTMDRITVVKEGAKGAVLGIVVAGKGKGHLQWVKIAEKKESGRAQADKPHEPTAAEIKRRREMERWKHVFGAFKAAMADRPAPGADVLLALWLWFEVHVGDYGDIAKLQKSVLAAKKKYPDQPIRCIVEWFWDGLRQTWYLVDSEIQEAMKAVGPMLGFDVGAAYAKAKEKVAKRKRKCRVCGCTDDDCSQCVATSGEPCHWVEDDLCSACADEL
jgi:ParB/RepB/Spo0J family partition protein